jgi:hypothetical protein
LSGRLREHVKEAAENSPDVATLLSEKLPCACEKRGVPTGKLDNELLQEIPIRSAIDEDGHALAATVGGHHEPRGGEGESGMNGPRKLLGAVDHDDRFSIHAVQQGEVIEANQFRAETDCSELGLELAKEGRLSTSFGADDRTSITKGRETRDDLIH